MKRKIESLDDLNLARKASRLRIRQLEEQIRDDVEELKESLKPVNLAGRTLKNLMTSDRQTIFGESLSMTIDAFIKKLVLRKSGFLTRTIVAFMLKNYARNLVSKNSENIFEWIQSLFSKKKNSHLHNGQYYDESMVNMD